MSKRREYVLHYPLLTEPEKARLQKLWKKMAAGLLARDGKNPEFPGGGHNVTGDPLLQQFISETFDRYMTLFHEQAQEVAGKQLSHEDIIQHPAKISKEIALFTREAAEALRQPNYGLPKPKKSKEADKPGMEGYDAYGLMASLIGHAVDTYSEAYKHRHAYAGVPATSLLGFGF